MINKFLDIGYQQVVMSLLILNCSIIVVLISQKLYQFYFNTVNSGTNFIVTINKYYKYLLFPYHPVLLVSITILFFIDMQINSAHFVIGGYYVTQISLWLSVTGLETRGHILVSLKKTTVI